MTQRSAPARPALASPLALDGVAANGAGVTLAGVLLLGALVAIPRNLGYLAVFLFVGVEAAGIPLPGETALIAGGVTASQGRLSIELVILAAAAGAIVGDNFGYLIGRRVGRRLLTRPGRSLERREAALKRGEELFERHGAKAVFFGRWIALLRIWTSWLAGMTHMRWPSFLVFNALGGITWSVTFGLTAYLAGSAAATLIGTIGLAAAGVAIVAVLIVGLVLYRRHHAAGKRARAAKPEVPPAS